MKKKWKVLILISSILGVVLTSSFFWVYFTLLHHYKGKTVINNWSEEDIFDISTIKRVEKKKGESFTILNLADVQMCDLEPLYQQTTIKKEIEELVDTIKPDLITLTGDQTWSNENYYSTFALMSWLEGFNIPYAPVFGNHDSGNKRDSAVFCENKLCELYENSKNCLFSRGPTNIGSVGNYAFNIIEDGEIVKTIYMIDAGFNSEITEGQLSWLKWTADGIKINNNDTYPEGMMFMHKPLPEYELAYQSYRNGVSQAIGDVEVHSSLRGVNQTGAFELAKSINVKDIVAAHQHWSNFTINYQDVRLTLSLKTGELSGYYEDGSKYLNGATSFKIEEETVEISRTYVSREKYHI